MFLKPCWSMGDDLCLDAIFVWTSLYWSLEWKISGTCDPENITLAGTNQLANYMNTVKVPSNHFASLVFMTKPVDLPSSLGDTPLLL